MPFCLGRGLLRRRNVPDCAVGFAAFVLGSSAGAATPPAQLLNKTVVAFSVMWPGAPGPLSVQRLIYVSSKGRIFVRGTRAGGSASSDITN